MKKEQKMLKESLPASFWKKWIKLDYIERLKHIEPIYSVLERLMDAEIAKKHKKELMIHLLDSYFEDLYTTTKIMEDPNNNGMKEYKRKQLLIEGCKATAEENLKITKQFEMIEDLKNWEW